MNAQNITAAAFAMLGESIAERLMHMADHRRNESIARSRNGEPRTLSAMDALRWGAAFSGAVAEVVDDYANAYAQRLREARDADALNTIFTDAATGAVDALRDILSNPHHDHIRAHAVAMVAVADVVAGRDMRRDAVTEARELCARLFRAEARRAVPAPDAYKLRDMAAALGADPLALTEEFFAIGRDEAARRAAEAKREAARARRAAKKGA